MKIITKFWIGIAVLIILSPLGIILPAYFKSGSAWGEWSVGEIQKIAGYIPQGLAELSSCWNAPIPEYAFKAEGKNLAPLSLSYVLSALIGVVITVLIVLLISRILVKKEDKKDVK